MRMKVPGRWIIRIIGIDYFLRNGLAERVFSRYLMRGVRSGMGLHELVALECRISALPDGIRERFSRIFLRIAGVKLARKLHDLGFRMEYRDAVRNVKETMENGQPSCLEIDWIREQAEDLSRLIRSEGTDIFDPTRIDDQKFGYSGEKVTLYQEII